MGRKVVASNGKCRAHKGGLETEQEQTKSVPAKWGVCSNREHGVRQTQNVCIVRMGRRRKVRFHVEDVMGWSRKGIHHPPVPPQTVRVVRRAG